jgi:hypothetical protein
MSRQRVTFNNVGERNMPRSIFEVAKELNLSDQDFRGLIDEGILDDHRLDESCLQKARKAFLDAARRKRPTERLAAHVVHRLAAWLPQRRRPLSAALVLDQTPRVRWYRAGSSELPCSTPTTGPSAKAHQKCLSAMVTHRVFSGRP